MEIKTVYNIKSFRIVPVSRQSYGLQSVFVAIYMETSKSICRPTIDQSPCNTASLALLVTKHHIMTVYTCPVALKTATFGTVECFSLNYAVLFTVILTIRTLILAYFLFLSQNAENRYVGHCRLSFACSNSLLEVMKGMIYADSEDSYTVY